ncbi:MULTISPECIES: RRXRR domain-containing protein [Thiocapsa]|jgi:hypothetical protein|uniref:RRXRR protein n=1 Tax=Thiocapsa roseopersicina TaxID=1058 RepID=A0A1H3AIT0_THIRO|nr:RRXRR domain-containing protein [Thiocapsa roseopersicina]SDX29523.1 RRXRR protein [Thiocapsa roseopersicina]
MSRSRTAPVQVRSPSGKPLSDCARRRAREMVRRGRATWISTTPPIIRLTEKPS